MSNGYSYVGNNPITSIDPSGEVPLKKVQYMIQYAVFYWWYSYTLGIEAIANLGPLLTNKVVGMFSLRNVYNKSFNQIRKEFVSILDRPLVKRELRKIKLRALAMTARQSWRLILPFGAADIWILIVGLIKGYQDYRVGRKFSRNRVKNEF